MKANSEINWVEVFFPPPNQVLVLVMSIVKELIPLNANYQLCRV